MNDKQKLAISDMTARRLRDWVCELLKYSDCLWGDGVNSLGVFGDFLREGYYGRERENPYIKFLQDVQFSDAELEDIAAVIVDELVSRARPADVILSMSENVDVLLNDEMSERWFRPFAGVERSSVAYQRGLALENIREYGLARAIMQEAADKGDELCALHLIEQKLVGEVYGFVDGRSLANDDGSNQIDKQTSVAFECGKAWIDHHNIEQGQHVLQLGADAGDADCALFLIENMYLRQYELMRSLK